MSDQHHIPAALSPGKRAGVHFTRGSMGIGAGLDEYGKTQPTGIRSPDRPARSESFRPLNWQNLILNNRKSSQTVVNKEAREGVLGIYSYSAKNQVDVNEKKIN